MYDFKCHQCGNVFDSLVKLNATVLPRCQCGGETTKLLSTPHINLPANSGFPGKDFRWIRDHEKAGNKTPQSV